MEMTCYTVAVGQFNEIRIRAQWGSGQPISQDNSEKIKKDSWTEEAKKLLPGFKLINWGVTLIFFPDFF